MITRSILIGASILFSIGIGFLLLSLEQVKVLLRFFAYPSLFAAFGFWVYFAMRSCSRELAIRWIRQKTNIVALIACLIGTLFLFTREPREYKIVHDEPTIINTSQNLHLYRDPVIKEQVHMEVISPSLVDKRPFFFAFLVSIFHDILGYDVNNGNIVNFLMTFLLLAAVYLLLTLVKSPKAGYIGIASFCSLPLMSQNASGLGFEIANLFMLVSTMIAALSYWKKPGNTRLGLLLFSVILLAHTRYESALYVFPVGIIILVNWIRSKEISLSSSLILCPLFFMPLAWQSRIVQSQSAKYMQLDSNDLSSAFGLNHIPSNLKAAISYFSGMDQDLAGSLILGPTGLIALAIAIVFLLAKPKVRIFDTNLFPIVAIGATTLILFVLLMAYYWGTLSDPVASRLSLPLWLFMLISLSIFLSSLEQRYRFIPVALLTLAFVHALPIMAAHPYSNRNLAANRYKWAESVIGEKLNSRTLVISNLIRMYQNRRIPSFDIRRVNYAIANLDLHIYLNTYESIYVIQHGVYKNFQSEISDGFKLDPMYQLETVEETSLYPYNFTRISRIVGVDPKIRGMGNRSVDSLQPGKKPVEIIPISPSDYKAWKESLP